MEDDLKKISDGALRDENGHLCLEGVPLEKVAKDYGTPCYLYSHQVLTNRINSLQAAFAPLSPLICYSVKANSNLTILKLMKHYGLGLDVVSEGELRRAIKVGFPSMKIVFAGVGKTTQEIDLAVKHQIFCLTVENEEELAQVEERAIKNRSCLRCLLRLNLDIDIDTHHYVKTAKKESKFGLDLTTAARLLTRRKKWLGARIVGIHFHLGSQIKETIGYELALKKAKAFCQENNFTPEILDIGGGFGIHYAPQDQVCPITTFASVIKEALARWAKVKLVLEPGRYLVGNSGFLLTEVLYIKQRPDGKTFVIVDAAMNDLVRPSFYNSYHHILPVRKTLGGTFVADVVGPICETGDYLARERRLPGSLKRGDLLVIAGAGAYGFSMASNYNSRRRPCEILVQDKNTSLIRKRESFSDLWRLEEL
ncbi:MAG: diaminopimelate decarboxylase [Candidatus Omnitrophica bacterium]|nr:diaminopimelate decarboxylase [Candidatus Omnitrophota bacterium]